MSEEGLASLAAEAKQTLGDAPAGEGAREGEFIPAGDPAAAEREKFAQERQAWAGVPYLLGGLLSKILPELKEVYTMPACLEWGGAMVPVARKYGWTMGGFEIEAALILSTWSLLSPTHDALKRKRAANAKPPEKTEAEASSGAAAESSAGAETHPDGSPK